MRCGRGRLRIAADAGQHPRVHRRAGTESLTTVRAGGRLHLRALPRAAGALGRQVFGPARRHEPGRALPPRRRDARLHAARDRESPDPRGRRERPRLSHRLLARSPDGEPAEGLRPLDVSWFTSDERMPRVDQIPARHRVVFERAERVRRRCPQARRRDRGGQVPACCRRTAWPTCHPDCATSTWSSARPTGSQSISRRAWSGCCGPRTCACC